MGTLLGSLSFSGPDPEAFYWGCSGSHLFSGNCFLSVLAFPISCPLPTGCLKIIYKGVGSFSSLRLVFSRIFLFFLGDSSGPQAIASFVHRRVAYWRLLLLFGCFPSLEFPV